MDAKKLKQLGQSIERTQKELNNMRMLYAQLRTPEEAIIDPITEEEQKTALESAMRMIKERCTPDKIESYAGVTKLRLNTFPEIPQSKFARMLRELNITRVSVRLDTGEVVKRLRIHEYSPLYSWRTAYYKEHKLEEYSPDAPITSRGW